jgi:hypothetical protein
VRKFIIAAVSAAFLAVPTVAAAAGYEYGEQPGYGKASCNGAAHGAFGAFDGGYNLGDFGGTPGYHNGAVGQEPGATGFNNSTAAANCRA